eukprot:6204615-Pleurochrysis_carterae.AAC.2
MTGAGTEEYVQRSQKRATTSTQVTQVSRSQTACLRSQRVARREQVRNRIERKLDDGAVVDVQPARARTQKRETKRSRAAAHAARACACMRMRVHNNLLECALRLRMCVCMRGWAPLCVLLVGVWVWGCACLYAHGEQRRDEAVVDEDRRAAGVVHRRRRLEHVQHVGRHVERLLLHLKLVKAQTLEHEPDQPIRGHERLNLSGHHQCSKAGTVPDKDSNAKK